MYAETIRQAAITKPGRNPAANIAPTETPVITAYMMNVIDGGMMMASPEATQTTAVAKALSYPALIMPGISIVPMAATVAEVEPLTAPQKAATAIAAIASPPTKCPSSQRRRFTIFSAMLAFRSKSCFRH